MPDLMSNLKEGEKRCPNCRKVFTEAGYPVKDSWTCSKNCFDTVNIRNPILQSDMKIDLVSRILLPDQFAEVAKESPTRKFFDELSEGFYVTMGELTEKEEEKDV